MSSIAKSSISISKKDLQKSRIPPVASRNVTFYHKATAGDLSINLNALTMPSAEMPTAVQATASEISGAQLIINKKNLRLISSSKGELIQHIDYVVTSSYNIQLIGPGFTSGAEPDEIFIGSITAAPISDLVVASAKSVDRTYTLAVGQTTLNLGREYQVGVNPNDDIGSIKVFVNGVLARRGADYQEIDSGNGYGTTIQFFSAPPTLDWQIVVDFGVMSITDNNALGTLESHAGAIKKLADDLAVVAGTSANDYLTANPSEVERRAFGDMVLAHDALLDQGSSITTFTKTKWQLKSLAASLTTPEGSWVSLATFNNLTIGNSYRITLNCYVGCPNSAEMGQVFVKAVQGTSSSNTSEAFVEFRVDNTPSIVQWWQTVSVPFVCTNSILTIFGWVGVGADAIFGNGTKEMTHFIIEELPNHEVTTQWT